MTKTALIVGVSGQDGSLLARLLLGKGYRVVGTSRDADANEFSSLKRLGIREDIEVGTLAAEDFQAVLRIVRETKPDEIYNVGGQSSVARSFEKPFETMQSHLLAVLHLMEAMRSSDRRIRLYNAGSGECFGDTDGVAADENTAFNPLSPYAVAKAAAHWQSVAYRNSHGLFVSNGIAFNHESSLRPSHFVTRKITSAVKRIINGADERLKLGNLSIRRDWGWAPEYVEAMWKMLQAEDPADYVLATGINASLEEFVSEAFRCVGLEWREHVDTDETLLRPAEIHANRGDASKIERELGWKATVTMPEVVRRMMEQETV